MGSPSSVPHLESAKQRCIGIVPGTPPPMVKLERELTKVFQERERVTLINDFLIYYLYFRTLIYGLQMFWTLSFLSFP